MISRTIQSGNFQRTSMISLLTNRWADISKSIHGVSVSTSFTQSPEIPISISKIPHDIDMILGKPSIKKYIFWVFVTKVVPPPFPLVLIYLEFGIPLLIPFNTKCKNQDFILKKKIMYFKHLKVIYKKIGYSAILYVISSDFLSVSGNLRYRFL